MSVREKEEKKSSRNLIKKSKPNISLSPRTVRRNRVPKDRVAREGDGKVQERREQESEVDRPHHPLGRRRRQRQRRLDFLRDVVS